MTKRFPYEMNSDAMVPQPHQVKIVMHTTTSVGEAKSIYLSFIEGDRGIAIDIANLATHSRNTAKVVLWLDFNERATFRYTSKGYSTDSSAQRA